MGASPRHAGRLTPLAEARDRLAAGLHPGSVETVPLAESLGRIAAVDLVAAADRPAADLALDDGWAVAAADTVGASPYAPALLSDIRPIAHGAALPAGTDAVLPSVGGRAEGGFLVVETALAPGENTRRRGADLPTGTVLVAAGRSIDPFAAATAALAGIETVTVVTRTIALRADPTSPSADLLAAVLVASGCRVDRRPLDAALPGDATPTIVVGGAHPDDGDVEIAGLAVTGLERLEIALGDGATVIGLPDRLETVALALETLIGPALRPDQPLRDDDATRPLARKLASRVGFTEVALLDVDPQGRWVPLAVGDLPWAAWIRARALVVLPPESEGLPENSLLAARRPVVRIRSDRRDRP